MSMWIYGDNGFKMNEVSFFSLRFTPPPLLNSLTLNQLVEFYEERHDDIEGMTPADAGVFVSSCEVRNLIEINKINKFIITKTN